MSKVVTPEDSLLSSGMGTAIGTTRKQVDLTVPGQMGLMNNLRYINSNASYVRRNIIAVVLEYPRLFNHLPNPEIWRATFKNLIENNSKTIDGLKSTYNVEFTQSPNGAVEFQHDVQFITRELSTPTHTHVEKRGRPITQFYWSWIHYGMGDAETQIPAVLTLPGNENLEYYLMPDFTSATVLYIEPNETQTDVEKAWLCFNMMPKTSGAIEGSRDIRQGQDVLEISQEFTCTQQTGAGVEALARSILKSRTLIGLNSQARENAFGDDKEAINAFLKEARTRTNQNLTGYFEGEQDVRDQQLDVTSSDL